MAPSVPAETDDGASRRGALARRLVELRETALGRPLKGLALASAVGTSKHSLWEWEHGRHPPGAGSRRSRPLLRPGGRRRSRSAPERATWPSSGGRGELHDESAHLPPGRRRPTTANA